MYKCQRCNDPCVTGSQYCAKHSSTKSTQQQRTRKAHHNLYNTKRWKALRDLVLSERPLCACCFYYGVTTPAAEVDHIFPVAASPELQYTKSNMQGLCSSCHSRKTNHEKYGKVYDYIKKRIVCLYTGDIVSLGKQ